MRQSAVIVLHETVTD